MLTVVDDVIQECLAAVPDASISAQLVVRELTGLSAPRSPGTRPSSDVGRWAWSGIILFRKGLCRMAMSRVFTAPCGANY